MFFLSCRIPTSYPLRRRVHNDVCAMVDWSAEEPSRSKSVVNDHRYARFVGNRCNLLEIGDVVLRVANALDLSCSQYKLMKNMAGTLT
jgi:hypothetical protein